MNKAVFLSSSVLVLACVCGHARQEMNSEYVARIEENIARGGYNTCPYEFSPQEDSKAPKGFKPFYISHYGRHGARAGWSDSGYTEIPRILRAADSLGLLTAQGDSLLHESEELARLQEGMSGHLLPRGYEEHGRLAERMYGRFATVFSSRGSRRIRAVSSTVPRSLMSMTAFTGSLASLDPKLEISWDTGDKYMIYVASDASKEAIRESGRMLKEFRDSWTPDTVSIMRTLFRDPVKARPLIGTDLVRFQEWIYSQGMLDAGYALPHSKLRFLPADAIYRSMERGTLMLYLRQCNSVEFGDERMRRTVPLIRDIIGRAEAAIDGSDPVAADLRFGHDLPLLACESFLGIEGIGERMTMDQARGRLFMSDFVPFAGNLQLIFYRNRAGEVLVKFLVNERESRLIGIDPFSGPYYRWSEVRTMLEERIQSLSE